MISSLSQQKAAQPDSVYLTFELDKGGEHCLLQKGCLLSAPGLEDEQPLYYALDQTLDVNQAKITQIRQVAVNSQDVVIEYDAATDRSLSPFHLIGKDKSGDELALPDQVEGQYSMATLYLSSALLYLAEGVRVITIGLGSDATELMKQIHSVAISTEQGWYTITAILDDEKNVQITLDKAFPAVT